MECLVLLASVRRSLFANDDKRSAYLSKLMSRSMMILSTGQGLNDTLNYHEMCRFISRLRFTYQLGELVSVPVYDEWIERVAKFTLDSFVSFEVGTVVSSRARLS